MQGILLIDKPKGWTSFDVVNFVRRRIATFEGKKPKNIKVGHTGTLDPLATGLLVLLVGKEYTRKAEVMSKHDKTYEVTMKLGFTSTTGDEEGDKAAVSDEVPALQHLKDILRDFTGHLMQTPPAFSAIKVDGKRSYDLARAGKAVELKPRPVTIYRMEFISYEYPFVRFNCDVSGGTYIRSLVEDIGSALKTGAYMSDLRRTQINDLSINDAVMIEDIETAINKLQSES